MELLGFMQFSEKYPLCGDEDSSRTAWARILQQWREKGLLKERIHWRHTQVNGQLCRAYNPRKVILLLCAEARGPRPRPRISCLYDTHMDAFVELLASTNPTNPTTM